MPKRPRFEIVFADQAVDHLDEIERNDESVIEVAIEEQLRYEPDVQTRNRKRLRTTTSFGASWELRCGPNNRYRVFYAVKPEEGEVFIVAIAEKIGNRLFIGGEEVKI